MASPSQSLSSDSGDVSPTEDRAAGKPSHSADSSWARRSEEKKRSRHMKEKLQSKKALKKHKERKSKKRKKSKSKEDDKARLTSTSEPVQLSKHLEREGCRRSSVSGKKIKLKVEKSEADKAEEQKRSQLLAFLNSSCE